MGFRLLKISQERHDIVLSDIRNGSEPEMRFYIMVAVSTMIACFGLITNSTAVIIGAMLVAPLMTPIFGIGLALIRSDKELFGKALKAEIAGVAAAVAMGIILGLVSPTFQPTPEMLARTQPQLFDLLVAVFSGFAGAYALMDEKISPALPGVAIATAIVPPLANTGLCFSVGEYGAGVGSFLLFFANFLSILLVASAAFWIFGMGDDYTRMDRKVVVRRFGLPIICFLLVAAFLTKTLYDISRDQSLLTEIEETLQQEFSTYRGQGASLDRVRYHSEDDVVYVLADIHAPSTFSPTQVSGIERKLSENLEQNTKLIIRSMAVQEITALDSSVHLAAQQLDGSFVSEAPHPLVRQAKVADSIIRNELTKSIGYHLDHVKVFNINDTPTFLASIHGLSVPHPESIAEMETLLRKKLELPEIRLVISFIETNYYDSSGIVRLAFSGLEPNYPAEAKTVIEKGIAIIREELAAIQDLFISGENYNMIDDTLYVLVDTVGPAQPSPQDVARIEKKAVNTTGVPIKFHVHSQPATVITAAGHEPYRDVSRAGFLRQLPTAQTAVRKILDASGM